MRDEFHVYVNFSLCFSRNVFFQRIRLFAAMCIVAMTYYVGISLVPNKFFRPKPIDIYDGVSTGSLT